MKLRVLLYDAFAEAPLGGNVAGVVLNGEGLSQATMQKIAAELGAPTTGFVVESSLAEPVRLTVRYFTPRQEIDLCGHVAVSVLTALADERLIPIRAGGVPIRHRSAAGELEAAVSPGEIQPLVTLHQRLPVMEKAQHDREQLERALGKVPLAPDLPVRVVSTGLRHAMVPYQTVSDLKGLDPDFRAAASISRSLRVDTVCAFAEIPRASGEDARAQMRDFCSGIGADEEPASGTTAGALACYLISHDPPRYRRDGEIRIGIRQGVELGRPSFIHAAVHVSGGAIVGVAVSGTATRSLEGRLHL